MTRYPPSDPPNHQASPPRSTTRRRVLRAGVLAGAAVTTGSSTVGALGRSSSSLEIDVRPPVDPDEPGLVPVKVHLTDEFDPTSTSLRYRFGFGSSTDDPAWTGARPVHHVELERGLLLFFRAADVGYHGEASTGVLRWRSHSTAGGRTGTASIET